MMSVINIHISIIPFVNNVRNKFYKVNKLLLINKTNKTKYKHIFVRTDGDYS